MRDLARPLTPEEAANLWNRPSAAGVYAALLGQDKDAMFKERELAATLMAITPGITNMVEQNRAFLRRAVIALAAEQGVRQFLDIGSGLPTGDNVHQVAQRVAPGSTTVYVDNDRRVVAHGHAHLATDDRTHFLCHDLRHPGELLHVLSTQRLLDFDRPVALFLVAVLHLIGDADEPEVIVDTLMAALPSGSFLVLSHALDGPTLRRAAQAYREAGVAGTEAALRAEEQVARFFSGLEILEPGLVPVPAWRPEIEGMPQPLGRLPVLGGVGLKP
ncbi:SAM-dependent methyltransferase [Sphaerisporangium melleum]|uniref:SAM-dependent methyltransferase n=1 Tax=Sphaerisporangium melleum TaxID=321316 RepID=UPI0016634986|nr:SAM-dependent methyltransferase [Sphaerisporangium melleum]